MTKTKMQPTVIKIKFTPVIRHLQKDNTKCCLEIVPDVSCIQNLDTIEWNNDNKLVEYSVPVTYKIILKRDKDNAKKPEKVYYSCIDLRLLSTNSTLACGDVTKVISDNYILSKVTADFESITSIIKESRRDNDTKNDVSHEKEDSINIREEINKVFLKQLSIKEGETNETARNNVDILTNVPYINLNQDEKPIKKICAECTVSKETITDIFDIRSNKKKQRQLTITSVCTLNTVDNPAGDTIIDPTIKNNSKICLKYKPKNKSDYECSHYYKISKVAESIAIHRSFYSEDNRLRIKNDSRDRILPELRVAHFMMTIENEILPLKLLLGEIYRKCASLGLLRKSNVLPESAPAFYPQYSDKIKSLDNNKRKSKCNRVVYSIVFEE